MRGCSPPLSLRCDSVERVDGKVDVDGKAPQEDVPTASCLRSSRPPPEPTLARSSYSQPRPNTLQPGAPPTLHSRPRAPPTPPYRLCSTPPYQSAAHLCSCRRHTEPGPPARPTVSIPDPHPPPPPSTSSSPPPLILSFRCKHVIIVAAAAPRLCQVIRGAPCLLPPTQVIHPDHSKFTRATDN